MVAEERSETCAALERDVVIGVLARRVLVLVVPDDVREVLDEVAAEADVEDLAAAADREDRHVALERRVEQSQLGAVALLEHALRLGMRVVAVGAGTEVGATGEDDPVEHLQRLLDPVVARRHQQRPPAGALDRAHVIRRNERRLLLPGAECGQLDVGRDADDRPHAPRTPTARCSPSGVISCTPT